MYFTQSLHRALQQQPDAEGVVFEDRRWTFAQFGDRVARLAGALQSLGMQPGDRVAMLGMNSDRYMEFQYAVPWAGGALNPVNFRWHVNEVVYSLNDSASTILIVDDPFAELIPQIRQESHTLAHVIYAGEGELPEGTHSYHELIATTDRVPDALRRGDDLLGVFYTGGTTGFPKGVMLSHTNLCSDALSINGEESWPKGGVYLHTAPMFHLGDMTNSTVKWLQGSKHIILSQAIPRVIIETVERERVTTTMLVPTLLLMVLNDPVMTEDHDISSLRKILYGTSPISEPVLDRALEAFGGAEFYQGYGQTELGTICTMLPPADHFPENRDRGKIRSAGRATFSFEVKIVDEEDNEVPRGTVGQVVARGPGVMLGYWNKPELTAESIKDGWMHTGDGAYMDDDGYIFIVDRMKDMIITGSENVYSAEVENVLAQHPAVSTSGVIGKPDEKWGEAVHAVVVLEVGMTATEDELIAHCRASLARYKCPRSIDFEDELPLSGTGKILKTELRKRFDPPS